jgi:glycyl-tRNA synthetase (class II)
LNAADDTIYIMIQRHYSPDDITAVTHSLEKEGNKKLREAGSTSDLLATKTTIGFKDEIETIGHYSYRRKDEIGSGYTSHVYRCRSIEKESDYAIKVIELKKYSASSLEMLDNEI